MELDDVGVIKKIRIGHDGKGSRADWYLEKVRNCYSTSILKYFYFTTLTCINQSIID